MSDIIKLKQSVIPSCDVPDLERLKELVKATADIEGIGAYKIGFELVIPFGMNIVCAAIRDLSDKPIIYDHQKAGTDIPDTGKKFFSACHGCDAVILFPQAGPVTQEAWIMAGKEAGMPVIIGGEMTHSGFLAGDNGYLQNDTPNRIYELAAKLGIRDFVVPGNKPERIIHYHQLLEKYDPVFYSPGLVSQGGEITAAAAAAGENWHAIVGRAIYEAEDMKKAAEQLTSFCKE
ncbi:MAG: orotidine 5'-phosphate decarboxylase / HUMPS family protein [Nanoarchaeota archaeon]